MKMKICLNTELCTQNKILVSKMQNLKQQKNSVFAPLILKRWIEAWTFFCYLKKFLSIIRPAAKSVFGIHDPKGLSCLTQLRVGLSKLNFHKFKHNFRTSDGIEDTANAPLDIKTIILTNISLDCGHVPIYFNIYLTETCHSFLKFRGNFSRLAIQEFFKTCFPAGTVL